MLIQLEKSKLKLDEIQQGEISLNDYAPHEQKVIRLVKMWTSDLDVFSFHTSGSTGKPKNIKITRSQVTYSCHATMQSIDPEHEFRSALLCINPDMIGGAMVVFRSLIFDLDLRVMRPDSQPFKLLTPEESYDLTSLVPLQLFSSSSGELDHFHTILVGGADIGHYINHSKANIYATFGMTETVSHFALRKVEESYFKCVGDAKLVTNNESRLAIKGTITNHQTLKTNDIVEVIDTGTFRWNGRADFVINSGGIKIHPEEVESKLFDQISQPFIISSLPDELLGNRVILIIEGPDNQFKPDFSVLERYQRPKEIHYIPKFILTSSGKIDRLATGQKLRDLTDKKQ